MMFTKLNIWMLEEYSKMLYIDADAVVLTNVDNVFDTATEFAAVLGGSAHHSYVGIEGGVILFKPSKLIHDKLVEAMNSDKFDLRMSDQTLLNDYFSRNGGIDYLDPTYNRLQKRNKIIDGAFVYHWNGRKPWIDTRVPNCGVWNTYYRMSDSA